MALELSRRLATLGDRSAFRVEASRALRSAFAADQVLWTSVDLVAPAVDLLRDDAVDSAMARGLTRHAADHPAIRSYVMDPLDRDPRRISDVVDHRTWQRSAAYNEVFRDNGGLFQLSLVVELVPPLRGDGWTLLRESRDFGLADVEQARLLLPLLIAFELMYRRLPAESRVSGEDELTERECQVLRLIATGLTDRAVGRVLEIGPRTVAKHLEHTYQKLGVHDRVSALNRARARGMVPG